MPIACKGRGRRRGRAAVAAVAAGRVVRVVEVATRAARAARAAVVVTTVVAAVAAESRGVVAVVAAVKVEEAIVAAVAASVFVGGVWLWVAAAADYCCVAGRPNIACTCNASSWSPDCWDTTVSRPGGSSRACRGRACRRGRRFGGWRSGGRCVAASWLDCAVGRGTGRRARRDLRRAFRQLLQDRAGQRGARASRKSPAGPQLVSWPGGPPPSPNSTFYVELPHGGSAFSKMRIWRDTPRVSRR